MNPTMNPLEFLKEVCGVEDLILPPAQKPRAEQTPFVFIIEAEESVFSASLRPLFEKIVAALKIPPSDYEIQFSLLALENSLPSRVCVLFGFHQGHVGWRQEKKRNILAVHSLQDMMTHPDLKKTTWSLLKDIAQ